MTAPQRDGKPKTPFSEWVRLNPKLDSNRQSLSIPDIDYGVHKFAHDATGPERDEEILMLLEEKQFMHAPDDPQRDTFNIIHQALRNADGSKVRGTMRGKLKTFRYRGFHLVQFEHTTPLDGAVYWDGRQVTTDQLIKLLRFEAPVEWYSGKRRGTR